MYIFLERMKSPSGMVFKISIFYSTYRMYFDTSLGKSVLVETTTRCVCAKGFVFFLQRNVYQTITRYTSLRLLLEYR